MSVPEPWQPGGAGRDEVDGLPAAPQGQGTLSTWKRGDFVNAQGWATMPGSEHPEVKIAEECARQILALSTL